MKKRALFIFAYKNQMRFLYLTQAITATANSGMLNTKKPRALILRPLRLVLKSAHSSLNNTYINKEAVRR